MVAFQTLADIICGGHISCSFLGVTTLDNDLDDLSDTCNGDFSCIDSYVP